MYGTASAFAMELGMEQHAALFHESEVKEKQVDDRLSQLAGYEINLRAKTPIVLNQEKV
jgi:ferritin-like metal-binding protein YciE